MLTTNSLGCPLFTTSGHRTLSVYIHLKPVMHESNIGKNVSQQPIFFPLAVIWRLPLLLLKTLPVLFPTTENRSCYNNSKYSSLVHCPAFDSHAILNALNAIDSLCSLHELGNAFYMDTT